MHFLLGSRKNKNKKQTKQSPQAHCGVEYLELLNPVELLLLLLYGTRPQSRRFVSDVLSVERNLVATSFQIFSHVKLNSFIFFFFFNFSNDALFSRRFLFCRFLRNQRAIAPISLFVRLFGNLTRKNFRVIFFSATAPFNRRPCRRPIGPARLSLYRSKNRAPYYCFFFFCFRVTQRRTSDGSLLMSGAPRRLKRAAAGIA